MVRFNDTSALNFMQQRSSLDGPEYCRILGEKIVRELAETGRCECLRRLCDLARQSGKVFTLEYIAICQAAQRMSESASRVRLDISPLPSEATCIDYMFFHTVDLMQKQARDTQERRNARRENRSLFSMAWQRPEAEAEAEAALQNARTEAARILEDAKREADGIRAAAKEQAENQYNELKQQFRPRAVREMIDDYRAEDALIYSESAARRQEMCLNLDRTHADLCDRMTRLQADMCDALNFTRNTLTGELVKWREELYRLETMDLAGCYVNLCSMLASLDRRIAESLSADADSAGQALAAELQRIRRNFGRFEKQLKNAMLGVGLDVYAPQPGDRFDPARHVVEEDLDSDALEGAEILRCIRPGVWQKKAGLDAFESMIRAEVEIRREAFE